MIGMMRPFYQAHWDISKDIKHVWLLICTYYIAWIFQWILSGEGRGKWWDRQYRVWIPQCAAPLDVTVTYARDSFVDSPSVLRPGWHMQETAFVDSQGGLLSSRGGAQTHWHRHIGTSLTIPTLTLTLMLNQLSQKYIRTILRCEITHYLVPLRRSFPCGDVPIRWRQIFMFSILCRIENDKICQREPRHKAALLLVAVSKMRTLAFIGLV